MKRKKGGKTGFYGAVFVPGQKAVFVPGQKISLTSFAETIIIYTLTDYLCRPEVRPMWIPVNFKIQLTLDVLA